MVDSNIWIKSKLHEIQRSQRVALRYIDESKIESSKRKKKRIYTSIYGIKETKENNVLHVKDIIKEVKHKIRINIQVTKDIMEEKD